MKRFIRNLCENKVIRTVLETVAVFLILWAILAYFSLADISKAPTFIYSQF